MTRSRLASILVPVLALALAGAPSARADVAPPDSCTGSEGAACQNAGPGYNSPGVCAKTTCTRTLPGTPPTTMQYDCMRCMAKSSADAGSGPKESSDDGCAYGGGRARGPAAVAALLLAIAAVARRRRSPRR
jgi:hypothetical protein